MIRIIDSNTVNIDSSYIKIFARKWSKPSKEWIERKEVYLIDWFSTIYDVQKTLDAPLFDFNAPVDSSWMWGKDKITVGAKETGYIMGISMEALPFSHTDSAGIITYLIEYLAKDYGIVKTIAEPGINWELTGCILNGKQFGVISDMNRSVLHPNTTELFQNFPNPFNPSTTVSFQLSGPSDVQIHVTDVVGRTMKEYQLGRMYGGVHSLSIDASLFPSGVYMVTMTAGTFRGTRKMLFLR